MINTEKIILTILGLCIIFVLLVILVSLCVYLLIDIDEQYIYTTGARPALIIGIVLTAATFATWIGHKRYSKKCKELINDENKRHKQ